MAARRAAPRRAALPWGCSAATGGGTTAACTAFSHTHSNTRYALQAKGMYRMIIGGKALDVPQAILEVERELTAAEKAKFGAAGVRCSGRLGRLLVSDHVAREGELRCQPIGISRRPARLPARPPPLLSRPPAAQSKAVAEYQRVTLELVKARGALFILLLSYSSLFILLSSLSSLELVKVRQKSKKK